MRVVTVVNIQKKNLSILSLFKKIDRKTRFLRKKINKIRNWNAQSHSQTTTHSIISRCPATVFFLQPKGTYLVNGKAGRGESLARCKGPAVETFRGL